MAIIANERGANDAVQFDEIQYLGFPFSISETFQQRNTNSSIEASLTRVNEIQNLCVKHHKKLVVYVSMAFGNPYGDRWHADIAIDWTQKLAALGIQIIALSDTIGVANPTNINHLFGTLIPEFKHLEIGAHLHTTPNTWAEKVNAAYQSGCTRFDGAMNGFGGCPMATDKLTGNMATENLFQFFKDQKIETGLDEKAFEIALQQAGSVFKD